MLHDTSRFGSERDRHPPRRGSQDLGVETPPGVAARCPVAPAGASAKRKVAQLEQDGKTLQEPQTRQESELGHLRTRV